jgi:ribonuclease HI
MSDYIQCFIDGAARNQGNDLPNEAAAAVVIFNNRKEIARFVRGLGPVSNNVAEFEALIAALLMCSMISLPRPVIYTDSQVVVNHVKGKWKCKSPELLPFYMTMREIQDNYGFDIVHVSRDKVFMPDHLCNLFLDEIAEEREKLKLYSRQAEVPGV